MVGEQYILGVALSNAKLGLIIHNAVMYIKTLLTPVRLDPLPRKKENVAQSPTPSKMPPVAQKAI